jgi:hypothetical protein
LSANSINFLERFIKLVADFSPNTSVSSGVNLPDANVFLINPPNGIFFAADFAISYCGSNILGAP